MTRLKAMRQRQGYTQKEIARKAGVNFRMYQSYEQGYKDINHARIETVQKIATALGCGMEDILNQSDES